MKNNFYILLTLIFIFNACEADTLTKKPPIETEAIKQPIQKEKENLKQREIEITVPPNKIPQKEYTFTFKNLQDKKSLIKMENDIYTFKNIKQPIVMVTIFTTWCPPCRGQIPHLTNLQKKFKENLFILGALVYDDIKERELKKFIIAEKALFFISKSQKENLKFTEMITPKLRLDKDFPMPLMILFFKGKYFTHYEGSMPEEMIESDIEQLLEKIEETKKN